LCQAGCGAWLRALSGIFKSQMRYIPSSDVIKVHRFHETEIIPDHHKQRDIRDIQKEDEPKKME